MNTQLASIAVLLKDPWTLSWLVSSFAAIIIPVIVWSTKRGYYYNSVGYALEAEEKQRQYYENQEQNNNNNNANGNYYSTYKECGWWNWACKKRQYYYATMQDNNNGEYREQLPGWYIAFGGVENSDEMRRWKEENTGQRAEEGQQRSEGGMKFVYSLTLIMFIALVAYGVLTVGKRQSRGNLMVFLAVTFFVAFTNFIMAVSGAISNDDVDLENSYYGWYGQMGVLLAYTDFWIMLFTFGYLVAFQVHNFLARKRGAIELDDGDEKEGNGYYSAPDTAMA